MTTCEAMTTHDTSTTQRQERHASSEERSTVELLRDLSSQMTTLVHEEVELAVAEVSAKGKRLGIGAGLFGASAVFLFLALASLAAAAIAALSQVVAVWLAAVLVAGGLLLIGMAIGGMALIDVRQGTPPVPQEAVASTKEDIEWLKTQAQSARR
jgi:uncharacterized membrane protein YqjE